MLAAKLKSWGATGKEERGIQSQSNIFASSSANEECLALGRAPSLAVHKHEPTQCQMGCVWIDSGHGSGLPWGPGQCLPTQDGVSVYYYYL